MRNGTSIPKSVRLARIQYYLHRHPKGLTSRELARLCGVCMRTIQRDIADLESHLGVPIAQDGDRYSLFGNYFLPPITFSLCEAMALFAASRLAVKQTDENNPYMQQALAKMASALPSPLAERLKEGIQTIAARPSNPDFLALFELVAIAWTSQRRLRIKYLSSQSDHPKEWLLEPYFVEMTGVGYSIYVIGHGIREGKEGIITFKLDRIKEAVLLDTTYEIPKDFDIARLLSSSWGVMWGDDTVIRLRFSSRVTRRVKESVWHPSQSVQDLPDGGCILTVKVGSALEMTPWIRGWGPDVEVLEPPALREQFKTWAAELNEMYSERQ